MAAKCSASGTRMTRFHKQARVTAFGLPVVLRRAPPQPAQFGLDAPDRHLDGVAALELGEMIAFVGGRAHGFLQTRPSSSMSLSAAVGPQLPAS